LRTKDPSSGIGEGYHENTIAQDAPQTSKGKGRAKRLRAVIDLGRRSPECIASAAEAGSAKCNRMRALTGAQEG